MTFDDLYEKVSDVAGDYPVACKEVHLVSGSKTRLLHTVHAVYYADGVLYIQEGTNDGYVGNKLDDAEVY